MNPNKKLGMPKKLKDGRAINVYLDNESIEKARVLGHGSVSAGIREAIMSSCRLPIFTPKA